MGWAGPGQLLCQALVYPHHQCKGVSNLSHHGYPRHPVAENHCLQAKLFAKGTSALPVSAGCQRKSPHAAHFTAPLEIRAAGERCH